ncbi:MAG TPA: S41 family peptidase [Anaerolineae bacterium]|nr:S41 family peptidase [Anaerolineae bacterium]
MPPATLGGSAPTASATAIPTTPPPLEMVRRHQRIFGRVWRIVERNYLYSDYNGVDWNAIREEYAPLVAAAPDDETFWQLMAEMIERLNDDHSGFLTPEEVAEEEAAVSGTLDYVGIGVSIAVPDDANYGVILYPMPGSPAESAGLRAHDRILAIDGVPTCCDADGYDNLDLLQAEAGTTVELRVASPGDGERTVTLERARIQAQAPIAHRRIPTANGDVGYVLIPTLWDETIAPRTREVLTAMWAEGPLTGLIVDLRVNGGGIDSQLYDLLSLFTEGEVGDFYQRGGKQDPVSIEADPIEETQTIPLVILVGPYTESFAEVLSGVLQDVGRAHLVGAPTAGNVETLLSYNLEDGSRLWLAEETFVPPSGIRWEGQGVQPDEIIPDAWEDFDETNDPHIAAALAWFTGD